ncbi:MAG: hypothetical protein QOK05_531 [Chloroflexota bacterium]|nr:hypothetical protein [Chloroflexota bacterium]
MLRAAPTIAGAVGLDSLHVASVEREVDVWTQLEKL